MQKMLSFKEITIEDYPIFKKFIDNSGEMACDVSFVNLLVWQGKHGNAYAISDNQLIIKIYAFGKETYSLPFGNDLEKGVSLISDYTGKEFPDFYAQQGARFTAFKEKYGSHYSFDEYRNAFDYIYLQKDISELSGKKYHSKRNHISAFTRQWDWHYEKIDSHNIDLVRECASCWYAENSDRMDLFLKTEQHGISLVLDNMELLGVVGGAVFVGGRVVAFTLGTPINNEVFDVHYEKALKNYDTAYTVINNQFVKNELSAYKYINREDDLGLEGLRKAKLSYKPTVLLEKFYCTGRQGND